MIVLRYHDLMSNSQMRYLLQPKDQPNLLHRHDLMKRAVITSASIEEATPTDPANSPVQQNTQTRRKAKKRHFFLEPTVLSRLILYRKFDAAVRRMQSTEYAGEASTWLYSDRDGHISMWQLPIHMATNQLYIVKDGKEKLILERLIIHLVLCYPHGCQERDYEGRLPLHVAVWNGAGLETVSALLIAAPKTVSARDQKGRLPVELNIGRMAADESKSQMQRMLLQPPAYWETARSEFNLRMKHRQVPDDGATITSTSVLADSIMMDDETTDTMSLQTMRSLFQDPSEGGHDGGGMQWKKHLEGRSIFLEKRLAESLEENYRLHERLLIMRADTMEAATQTSETTSDEKDVESVSNEQDLNTLTAENEMLRNALSSLALKYHGLVERLQNLDDLIKDMALQHESSERVHSLRTDSNATLSSYNSEPVALLVDEERYDDYGDNLHIDEVSSISRGSEWSSIVDIAEQWNGGPLSPLLWRSSSSVRSSPRHSSTASSLPSIAERQSDEDASDTTKSAHNDAVV